MLLQLTNAGLAPITIKDPAGYTNFTVVVDPATTKEVDVSEDLLQRLAPQLTALETPLRTTDGTDTVLVALRWAVVASTTLDDRVMRAGLAGLPKLNELQAENYSTGGGATGVVAAGVGLLGNQAKASLNITDAAETMQLDLEAVGPGASANDVSVEVITPASTLLVSVVANKITIRPASGGSTISAIAAAINAEADALLLVQASEGTAGTLNEAVAEQSLTGGTGPGVSLSLSATACVITEMTDTQVTFNIPTGIAAASRIVPLVFRNGPNTSALSVPVVA